MIKAEPVHRTADAREITRLVCAAQLPPLSVRDTRPGIAGLERPYSNRRRSTLPLEHRSALTLDMAGSCGWRRSNCPPHARAQYQPRAMCEVHVVDATVQRVCARRGALALAETETEYGED